MSTFPGGSINEHRRIQTVGQNDIKQFRLLSRIVWNIGYIDFTFSHDVKFIRASTRRYWREFLVFALCTPANKASHSSNNTGYSSGFYWPAQMFVEAWNFSLGHSPANFLRETSQTLEETYGKSPLMEWCRNVSPSLLTKQPRSSLWDTDVSQISRDKNLFAHLCARVQFVCVRVIISLAWLKSTTAFSI